MLSYHRINDPLHPILCALTARLAGQAAGGVAALQAAKKNHPGASVLQEHADLLLFKLVGLGLAG